METSITSETISQQTICGDNKALGADMETKKEPIKFEWKKNQLSKAKEIYFKYCFITENGKNEGYSEEFGHDGFAPSIIYQGEHIQRWKQAKPHESGIKRLEKMKPKVGKAPSSRRWFMPGMTALQEIWRFQKSTELLIPEVPFLWMVGEILQGEHGDHHIQAGAVLVLHEATEAYLICTA